MKVIINSDKDYGLQLEFPEANITILSPHNIDPKIVEKMINKENASIDIEHTSSSRICLGFQDGVFSLRCECFGATDHGKNMAITANITLPSDLVITQLTDLLKIISLGAPNHSNISSIKEIAYLATSLGIEVYENWYDF